MCLFLILLSSVDHFKCLQRIFIFSGVVVIDDIYGDAVDDHEFSPENEGFQEVTSKKALKLKQKAQQEAELKKQISEKQKKDAHNKVLIER